MNRFAVQKTLNIDVCSDPTPSDHQASLSSIQKPTRKRTIPGTLDPNTEVIALSPKSLQATNKYVCEVCGKGFQRDQNLQLHRRGHNLPWKLKQRQNNEVVRRKVYICPKPSCSNHLPSRALGDLTGIKKHFFRKHGEKRWSCDKCSKKYAVLSDWKAHSKICGSKEYRCECGTIVSRRDSFITHKAFCEVLASEKYTRTMSANQQNLLHLPHPTDLHNLHINNSFFSPGLRSEIPQWLPSIPTSLSQHQISNLNHSLYSSNSLISHLKPPPLLSDPNFSATALLQIESTISRPSELHSWLSSNSQEMSNGVFELASSVSSPLQFGHSFPSYSGFGSPFEETVAGQVIIMSPKRGERSAEDFMVGRNIVGDQAGRDETTRDFLGLRVPSHEELFSLSAMETCMGSSSSFG